jgi:hypothetical protein
MARMLSGEVMKQPGRRLPAQPAGPALQRVQVKQEIIALLIGGRLDLFEAARRFQVAQGNAEANSETVCRQVIGWAHLALSDRPERAEAVANELERQLNNQSRASEQCGSRVRNAP